MRLSVLVFSSLVVSSIASADGALALDSSSSKLSYNIVHKLKTVEGVSQKVEGRARVQNGKAQVMIRVPVESFDSGNTSRDAHMKEVTEAAKYPTVELKASVEDLPIPAQYPATVDRTWKAQVQFHGVTQTIDVPVKLVVESPDKMRAKADFALSLDAFKVERPSLLFVKIDDQMKVKADLVFSGKP